MMRLGWVPDLRGRGVVNSDSALATLEQAVDFAIESGRFAFDTETTGLDVLDGARMFMCSFSWLSPWVDSGDDTDRLCPFGKGVSKPVQSCAVFIGHRHQEVKLNKQAEIFSQLRRLLTSRAQCVMFNAKFDAKMLWADGLPTENLYQDVMLDMFVLDPGFGDSIAEVKDARKAGKLKETQPMPRDLKGLSEIILGWPPEERDEIHGWLEARFGKSRSKWKFNYVPQDLVAVYGCADTERTLALSYWTEAELAKREQTEIARMETDLTLLVAEMELNGLPIDAAAIEKHKAMWLPKRQAAHDKLLELTGLTQLSVMSQEDLANYAWPALQKQCQEFDVIWGTELAKTPVPQNWDVDALSKYATRKRGSPDIIPNKDAGVYGEFCAGVLTVRMIDKVVGTYFDSWKEKHLRFEDKNDLFPRLHPNLRQDGTDTGRFSCKEPNLQNVPVEARLAGPPPGYSLVFIDYSQLEYRVFAHYAGGEVLDKYLKDPHTDFHQALADMLGISRKAAKNLNFGILYGMGKDKLVASLSGLMSAEDSLKSYNIYHQKFPQAKALYYEAQRRAKERGWIKNLFGRRRYLNPDFAHVAFNTIVQGSAADVVKRAMLRVQKVLLTLPYDVRMLLQIHDELIFQVEQGKEQALIDAMQAPMTDEPRLTCPLLVDASVCMHGELWMNKHGLGDKNAK